jgi:subtilase family serine protease
MFRHCVLILRNSVTILTFFAIVNSLNAQLRTRVTKTINNTDIVRIARSTHPLVSAAVDAGRVASGVPMQRMILQLKGSPEQQAELDQLVDGLHDPASPNYQQWLTPEQFGERFGPAQQDLDAVTGWLQSQGFHVDEIAAGRGSIQFSGTAGQVETAFHTEMHHYVVNGQRHLANATDIAIPDALSPVVEGLVSLHDFRTQPFHHVHDGPSLSPVFNLSSGGHAMSPYDFAAIYDVAALWNLGFDGTGQTIAIAGRTNISASDVSGFRSQFGLTGNNTQIIVNGTNPGIISSGEEMEADLDVEWSGAVAKGATVQLVVSADTNTSDGISLSSSYIVNHNQASVMSLSFGACEASMGTSGNSFFNSLWQQAAAQGISVFIAAGDSGSAGCDIPNNSNSRGQNTTQPASHGLAVNGLASTPYNVAVGGTEFLDSSQPSAYWNGTMDSHYASAKGYIPESVWNESSYTTLGASSNGLWAGSGGVSIVYPTPSWQAATGVPASDPFSGGHHRYLPDVSLTGAGHDGYIVEHEGGLYLVGGTSASSPSFAGIQAVLNQYTGGRNGNPAPKYYSLASKFHDATTGTNAVPCTGGTSGCSAASGSIGVMNGFNAGVGFDLATGLGSADAYALALAWGSGAAKPPAPAAPAITSLSPSPMTGSASNQTLTINGSGFQSGLTVVAGYPGFSVNLTVSSVSATQIQAIINTGTTARTWSIQVLNPGNVASNTSSLQVNAPAPPPPSGNGPTITSATTNSYLLVINGSGFQSGLTLTVTYPGGTLTEGSGYIYGLNNWQVVAYLPTYTATGTRTVQITNPGGQTSNVITIH